MSGIKVNPLFYAPFVCSGQIGSLRMMCIFGENDSTESGGKLFGTLAHVKDYVMDWTSHQSAMSYHSFLLDTEKMSTGLILLWVLSRYRVSSHSLLSGLFSQKGASCWPWSQNRKSCHSTTLTHRCFLIQAQGELLQPKPNCLQSSARLSAYVRACGRFFFLQANPHVCSPESV